MNCLVLLSLFGANAFAATIGKANIDPTLSGRVVGGNDAEDGAHPYQISIRSYGSHSCGGIIVHPEWVLTAAHCVNTMLPSEIFIVAGSNKLSEGGDKYEVLEIYCHENFDPLDFNNDVAILKTKPMSFSDKVKSIVVDVEYIEADEPSLLSGWGSMFLGGRTPDNLQELDLKTTTLEYCKSRHTDPVYETQICTLTKSGEGACHGDSGGPLTRVVNGVRKLIGIVSWGIPCAKSIPDVFARVASFIQWFNNKCSDCIRS